MTDLEEYENRNALLASGKSVHHLVTQPGENGRGRNITPVKAAARIASVNSEKDPLFGRLPDGPNEAMNELQSAKNSGTLACDWGCTTKVQSRGCTRHAQVKWLR